MMAILIACEESQAVCKAFRARGFEAYSCDIQPCSGGHPEWHIQGDVLPLLKEPWDLVIAHPPCTYLSHMGARWLYAGGKLNRNRYKKGIEAKSFFLEFLNSNSDKIAIENPRPSSIFHLPGHTQIIQPYYFGNEAQKETLLWLKNLPLLKPTKIVGRGEFITYKSGKTKAKWFMDAAHSTEEERKRIRSKTFPGIAAAMAQQWGDVLLGKNYASQSRILEQVELW